MYNSNERTCYLGVSNSTKFNCSLQLRNMTMEKESVKHVFSVGDDIALADIIPLDWSAATPCKFVVT